jgi:hypothetical protein
MSPAANSRMNDEISGATPHVYQINVIQARVIWGLFASIAVLVIGTNVLRLMGTSALITAIVLIFAEIAGIRAAMWIAPRYGTRVLLYDDAIEVRGWFSNRKLRRDEIRGRRVVTFKRGGYRFVMVPVDRTKGNLALPALLHTDKHFYVWMKDIPKIER